MLTQLELQVEHLLADHRQLRGENGTLRKKLAKLKQERAVLADKHHKAMQQVRRILSNLKGIPA